MKEEKKTKKVTMTITKTRSKAMSWVIEKLKKFKFKGKGWRIY